MELEGSLLCWQEPATCPILSQIKPVNVQILFLEAGFNIILLSVSRSFLQVSQPWQLYSCKYGLARPQVGDGGEGLQIWMLAANILNNQSRTADKRRSFPLEFGRGANKFLPWKFNNSFFSPVALRHIPGHELP